MSDLIRSMSQRPSLPQPRPQQGPPRSPFQFIPFSGSIKRQHRDPPKVEGVPPIPGMKRGIKDNET